MIQGKASEEEMDELEGILDPGGCGAYACACKCACLGWHTAKEMLEKKAPAANVRHVMNNRFRFDAPSVADEEELERSAGCI